MRFRLTILVSRMPEILTGAAHRAVRAEGRESARAVEEKRSSMRAGEREKLFFYSNQPARGDRQPFLIE